METMIPGGRINVYFGKHSDENDPKSVKNNKEHVPNGSIYYEMDTCAKFFFDAENKEWLIQQ